MSSVGGDARTDCLMMVALLLPILTLKSVHVVVEHQTLRRYEQGFSIELDAPRISHWGECGM